MREILPGILTWGSTYADQTWDLNGYAITLDGCTVLVDPPAPEEDDWNEVMQLAPIAIDEAVREGDLIAGVLRPIHLPGKSAGEIGLYFDPAHHAVSRERGGILVLGDAILATRRAR